MAAAIASATTGAPPEQAVFKAPPPPPRCAPRLALPVPRVHVSDARVEASPDPAYATVKLVAEVVVSDTDAFSRFPPDLVARLEAGDLTLCVGPVTEPPGDPACFATAAFNEFSTMDVSVPWRDRLAISLWCARSFSRSKGGRRPPPRRLATPDGPLAESETYVSFDVDGTYEGLGVSTITHAGDVALPTAPRGTFEVVDWRPFAGACATIALDVLVEGRSSTPVTFVGDLGHPTALQGQRVPPASAPFFWKY